MSEKKGLFRKIIEKIDKSIKEKSKNCCCCSSCESQDENDKE